MGLFSTFLFVILTLVVATAANNCYKPCTRDYRPVCGFDGYETKTYDNKCLFDIANCGSNYQLSLVREGKCEEQTKNDCNKICTMEYNPVCGSDGQKMRTYGNMCSFENANCENNYKMTLTRNGECLQQEEKLTENECQRPCPSIYLPVCGFDGKSYQTFASTCEYDVMNCLSKNHLRFIKMGEC